jgi:hypothetical protein
VPDWRRARKRPGQRLRRRARNIERIVDQSPPSSDENGSAITRSSSEFGARRNPEQSNASGDSVFSRASTSASRASRKRRAVDRTTGHAVEKISVVLRRIPADGQ